MEAARQAAKKKAAKQAKIAEDKIDEILEQGGFYKALAEFLVDLPLFPFACIKGPMVRIVPSWCGQGPVVHPEAQAVLVAGLAVRPLLDARRLRHRGRRGHRAHAPHARRPERSARLPGYNEEAIRAVLDEYGRGGIDDNWDTTDAERAVQENRENPVINQSG
jgi:hypothetical protein